MAETTVMAKVCKRGNNFSTQKESVLRSKVEGNMGIVEGTIGPGVCKHLVDETWKEITECVNAVGD